MIEGGVSYSETMFVQTTGKLRPVVHNIGFDSTGRFLFQGDDTTREGFANLMATYGIYPEDELPEGRTPLFDAETGAANGAADDTAAAGNGEPPAADGHEAAKGSDADGGADGAADASASGADGTQGDRVGSTGSQGAAVTPAKAAAPDKAKPAAPAAPAAPASEADDGFI